MRIIGPFTRIFRSMSNFVQRKDGQWEVVGDDYGYQMEIARSGYADMLHDLDRNQKYFAGIRAAVREIKARGEKVIVLDIGTGTGLLSMMASAAGADLIFACEAFLPMYEIAKRVIARNGLTDKIKLIPKRSTDLKIGPDLDIRANILVTEVFDTEVIGEGAIGTYNHAITNLMQENFIAVPDKANMYFQLVHSNTIQNFNTVFDVPETLECSGLPSVHDLQLSKLTDFREVKAPQLVFQYDFKRIIPVRQSATLTTGCDNFNAAFMFWTLEFNPGNEVISCEPEFVNKNYCWREHWIQSSYYIPPRLRKDEITINQTEFDYNFDNNGECVCGYHRIGSRIRLHQLSNTNYNFYPKHADKIVVLSDDTLLPHKLKTKDNSVTLVGSNTFKFSSDEINNYDGCVVMGDPYFQSSLSCIDNLKFFELAKQFNPVKTFPCKAVVNVANVKLHHLWKIRAKVESTCGFILKDFDDVIMSASNSADEEMEPHPLWQYDLDLISSDVLFEVDHTTNVLETKITSDPNSNALVIYTDFIYDEGNVSKSYDGEFTKNYQQNVIFLNGASRTFDFKYSHGVISILN